MASGDTVITETIDAGGTDKQGAKCARGPNPMNGPIAIEGAMPGDALKVEVQAPPVEGRATEAICAGALGDAYDVLEEITGALSASADPRAVRREDGSWLVDGALTMDEFWESLGLEDRRGEERIGYNTLGGLVVTTLGRIPRSGDVVEALGLRFEVMDMDGHRVDKVLVGTPLQGTADSPRTD